MKEWGLCGVVCRGGVMVVVTAKRIGANCLKCHYNNSSESVFEVNFFLSVFSFSPEIIQNLPYSEKADVWAIGCVLYQMCTLQPPFHSSNMLALASKVSQRLTNY